MKHSLAKQVAFIRNTPASLLLVKVANANVRDIYECLYTNQPVDGVYDRQQMYTVYTLLLDSPMHTTARISVYDLSNIILSPDLHFATRVLRHILSFSQYLERFIK